MNTFSAVFWETHNSQWSFTLG